MKNLYELAFLKFIPALLFAFTLTANANWINGGNKTLPVSNETTFHDSDKKIRFPKESHRTG
ncbi:MAG: hypothetical protein IPL53_04040 [Ignavibacteria bacterium]|nr:hypothetical protein [Ignavibacteria bacterium]